ncbi:PIG-L family deacetylase [Embleya scabrispora]|uniref:PIG-L family deacetylase n=1 Tax=Embleya scabrispora TaxID=159449 RepID=UPI001374BE34|nr:PIG-L family deacetylase [Embleya scabrispora]
MLDDDDSPTQPKPAQVPPSAERVLNVVAHHDDDLLFLSPELLENLRAGATVRTVYFMASDYSNYPKFMQDREVGLRRVYADTLGMKLGQWKAQPYEKGGVQATLWTLGDRVSILETRIPDGYMKTPLGAKRMWGLYSENMQIKTRPGETFPVQEFNRDALVAFLRGVRDEIKPDRVNTLDPFADLGGSPDPAGGFHQDHVAVARMVMYALEQDVPPSPVHYFRDYTIEQSPPNLSPERARAKAKAFKTYTEYDPDAKRSKVYGPWLRKTYEVDGAWRGDLLVPLPAPDRIEKVAGRPYVGSSYRIVNRANRLELVVRNEANAPLSVSPAPSAAGGVFKLLGIRYGWGIMPKGSSLIVGMPESDKHPEHVPRLVERSLDGAQALRAHGDVAGGFELLFAHSGMALTAPRQPGGDVTQAPSDKSPAQKWDFIPV